MRISICPRVWVLDVLDSILVHNWPRWHQGEARHQLAPLLQSAYECCDVKVVVGCETFPLSTTILIGSTLADWCLTLHEKTTMYFSQSFLGFVWNPTEPSKRIMANSDNRCSDNCNDQMGYLAIRCHHHRRWNPAHHLFSTRSYV